MSDFFNFNSLLPKALAKYQLTRQARAAAVCERFRKLANQTIAKEALTYVKPKFFKGHTLVVSVPSSVWAQRVIVHRHELIEALNEKAKEGEEVHEIRTVVEIS